MINLFKSKNFRINHTQKNPESKILGVCIDEWFGVKKATYGNFENVLELQNISRGDYIEQIMPVINAYDVVIFNGMTELFSALIDKLSGKRVFVMYHGSPTLHSDNEYENFVFQLILQKSFEKNIEGIIFIKKDLEKLFGALGHNTMHLPNRMGNFVDNKKVLHSEYKIGVLSQLLLWNKNIYNQILAAISLENTQVYVNVDKSKLGYLAEESRITSVGVIQDPVDFEKFLSSLDINMNVTLTEAYPMNIIESLQVGIPCLTSRTNHIFEESEILSKYLVVDDFDNASAIANKLKEIMTNYGEIVTEIHQFRIKLKEKNDKLWEEFLNSLATPL